MTPADPIEAFVWMAALIGMFGLPLLLVAAAIEWLVERTAPRTPPPRAEERVSSEELALLGEDWRDNVADWVGGKNRRDN